MLKKQNAYNKKFKKLAEHFQPNKSDIDIRSAVWELECHRYTRMHVDLITPVCAGASGYL